MIVYGSEICIDCRNLLHLQGSRGLELDYRDITADTATLKEFLRLRDTEACFADCRRLGGIGIPCFVEGERVTLDVNEALSWLKQPPVREEELAERHPSPGAWEPLNQ